MLHKKLEAFTNLSLNVTFDHIMCIDCNYVCDVMLHGYALTMTLYYERNNTKYTYSEILLTLCPRNASNAHFCCHLQQKIWSGCRNNLVNNGFNYDQDAGTALIVVPQKSSHSLVRSAQNTAQPPTPGGQGQATPLQPVR